MLSVVCWKWGRAFGPEYVNRLRSMLARHLHAEHELHCITDDPLGLDVGIHLHDGLIEFADHAEMHGTSGRSCFRRLRLLDRETALRFGPRVLQLDLDVVFTDDVTPLFDRPEPLVVCEQNRVTRKERLERSPRPQPDVGDHVTYNPSMMLMDAGVLQRVWDEFHADPQGVWQRARKVGWSCSDMAVLNYYLAPMEPATWTAEDGVRAYWRLRMTPKDLPAGTRAVLFYGQDNPSDAQVQQRAPWVLEHWR